MPNSPVEVRSEVVPFMTEERLALQEMARDFAMREVLLIANELDPVAGEIPMGLRRKMADLGFFGILVPEEYGGLGLGLSEYAVIVEELARAWMSVASLIARGQQFTAGFNAEQRERTCRGWPAVSSSAPSPSRSPRPGRTSRT